ncbi:MAG: serine/threonine protein kinase [Candidatus Abyssobacteria bacterium SURF_5]|uniref:non-specific serine/threonine protein kinase n=1 Tax=Abyssobacteria bacterium (strain SURF_5) TaxID=2093360 RepID=A0A3A4P0G8_ABYX5|nr:MAG: serine/threonine protein kinase [Candidatus Abyssubacteria bacterium SURF_5]
MRGFMSFLFWLLKKGAAALGVFLREIFRGILLMPGIVRKPSVLGRCLLTAHLAQITVVLVIVGMASFVPAAVDAQLEKLYPPTTVRMIFGLRTNTMPHPRLDQQKKLARHILWAGSGSLIVCLFLLHVPRAVNRTTALARRRESEADVLLDSEPSASALLYAAALSLAVEPDYEKTLNGKLLIAKERVRELNQAKGASAEKAIGPAPASQTVDLPGTSQEVFNQKRGAAATLETCPSAAAVVGPDGRYCIRHEIGRGAMGIVFRAYDSVLARDVALKQLPDSMSHDEKLAMRFQQEARTLARLNHPNIVHVYDFVEQNGQCWIAMELVEGEELDALLRKKGPLPIHEAVRLIVQLAEALAYAHEHGVVHRDVKPANIFVTGEGLLKIGDFGLAKLAQSSLHTHTGTVLGSPAYMSPEQAEGKEADSRSDIYAFGVTVYKILSGHLPFTGGLETVIVQKLTREPPSLRGRNDQIPEQLDELVLQMLAKDPEKRPNGMRACLTELQAFADLSEGLEESGKRASFAQQIQGSTDSNVEPGGAG